MHSTHSDEDGTKQPTHLLQSSRQNPVSNSSLPVSERSLIGMVTSNQTSPRKVDLNDQSPAYGQARMRFTL